MQKKKANIEQLTAVIKKYKVVGSFFFVSCTSCFWLGTYYEKIMMTREITEIISVQFLLDTNEMKTINCYRKFPT